MVSMSGLSALICLSRATYFRIAVSAFVLARSLVPTWRISTDTPLGTKSNSPAISPISAPGWQMIAGDSELDGSKCVCRCFVCESPTMAQVGACRGNFQMICFEEALSAAIASDM